MSKTIVTLTAVVALTLAACASDTTRGWSDKAFGDLMTYCQATEEFGNCSGLLIQRRDTDQCSVEATYRVIDRLDGIDDIDERLEALDDLMAAVLQPKGDCLEYTYTFPGE